MTPNDKGICPVSQTQQTAGPPPQHPKGLFPSSFSNRSHTWSSLPHEAAPFWLQTWVRILEFLFSNRSPLILLSRRVCPLLRTPEVPWDLRFNFSVFKPLTCSLWRRPQKCSLLRLHLIKPRRRKLNLWNRRCDLDCIIFTNPCAVSAGLCKFGFCFLPLNARRLYLLRIADHEGVFFFFFLRHYWLSWRIQFSIHSFGLFIRLPSSP